MPPLKRTSSCTDIGFTLRRQFHKEDFRYTNYPLSSFLFVLLCPLTFTRPHQREIIEAALDGFDVYVQAATSFGKSLCFQLPAVIDQGSEFSATIHLPSSNYEFSYHSCFPSLKFNGKKLEPTIVTKSNIIRSTKLKP